MPAGQHTIEFKFEPATVDLSNTLLLIGSILTFVLLAAAAARWRTFRRDRSAAFNAERRRRTRHCLSQANRREQRSGSTHGTGQEFSTLHLHHSTILIESPRAIGALTARPASRRKPTCSRPRGQLAESIKQRFGVRNLSATADRKCFRIRASRRVMDESRRSWNLAGRMPGYGNSTRGPVCAQCSG